MKHKHAEILQAIANGESMDDFEVTWGYKRVWYKISEKPSALLLYPDFEVRRVPKFIEVNGFKVPEPLKILKKDQQYFMPRITYGAAGCDELHNYNEELGERHCKTGLVHDSPEKASAHAKAILCIDQEAD